MRSTPISQERSELALWYPLVLVDCENNTHDVYGRYHRLSEGQGDIEAELSTRGAQVFCDDPGDTPRIKAVRITVDGEVREHIVIDVETRHSYFHFLRINVQDTFRTPQ